MELLGNLLGSRRVQHNLDVLVLTATASLLSDEACLLLLEGYVLLAAQNATELGFLLDDGHLVPTVCRSECCHHAGDAAARNHDLLRLRGKGPELDIAFESCHGVQSAAELARVDELRLT